MKKSIMLMAAVLTMCLSVFTSCNSDDNRSAAVTDQALPGCFNKITAPDGTVAYYDEVSYTLTLDYGSMTAKLAINGLKTGGTSYSSIKIDNLPFKSEKGVKSIDVPSMTALSNGMPVNITGLKFKLMDRIVGAFNYPMLYVSYTLDDRYTVESTRKNIVFWGETKTVSPEGRESKTTVSYYEVVFDPKTVMAAVNIYNAQFIPSMPMMTMTFPGIPFTFNGEKMSLRKASLEPVIGTTPYPAFPITSFVGEVDMFDDLVIDFDCNYKGSLYHVNFEGEVTEYYSR